MRRVGRVLTGVDRVELAYLRALRDASEPVFGLIRSRIGYILLNADGIAAIAPLLTGPDGRPADEQSRKAWRLARRVAQARVPPFAFVWMLRRHVPQGAVYLNTGHSNLTDRVLRGMKSAGIRTSVFVHDVIPLEFPHLQRDGSVAPFREMIDRVGALADLVIYNSQDTRRRAEAQFASAPPASIVAHLGTEIAPARLGELPVDLPPRGPYFVVVGTIEPRKNHAFLLDLWEEMGPDAPTLVIAGMRGWKNEGVFGRLDRLPTGGNIREAAGLSDGALAALIEGARGVLLPSIAEGYGLPVVEAAARGVPVVVNTLEVFEEVLDDIPIYVSVSDRYLWIHMINVLAEAGPRSAITPQVEPPTWDAHFKTVLRLT